MTLSAGTRLGSYEILAPLGAGGMGEVYRARDTRLSRDVAVKVLPAEVSGDAERRARFEQEAQSASALNHPNIVTIHDIGTAEGGLFIAMELVDGKTLRELLAVGPMPLRKTLSIAAQVADGLAKAHAAGIVHRDLKPENVMVTRDGFVKILDFGLAKLVSTVSDAGSQLPTIAAPGTRPGIVMGTVGYMSPEQASGGQLDFRSDQFSLGAILYEMATGRRAFQKGTAVETLSAIIREEPEPIAGINPGAPAPLRWIVERCLAKDPEDRYASTRDLARDLKQTLDHLAETSAEVPAAVGPGRRPRRAGPWPALAGLLAVALAATWILRRAPAGQKPSLRSPELSRITFTPGLETEPAWSPDGKFLAYTTDERGNLDIVVAPRAGGEPIRVAESEADEAEPAWSPDGSKLAFVSARDRGGRLLIVLGQGPLTQFLAGRGGDIFVAPALGGQPAKLVEDGYDPAWSPDGKRIVFRSNRDGQPDLWVVPSEGGNPVRLTRDVDFDYQPAWSPDGKWIAYGSGSTGAFELKIVGAEGGPARKLTALKSWILRPAWSADGRFLYFSANRNGIVNVWKLPFTPSPGGESPSPARVTIGQGQDVNVSVSRTGDRIAFATVRSGPDIWELTLATGRLRQVTSEAGLEDYPHVLPDGKTLLVESDRSGSLAAWTLDMNGKFLAQLTRGETGDNLPRLSSDGRQIAFVKDGKLFLQSVGGMTAKDTGLRGEFPSWSPDNRRIALHCAEKDSDIAEICIYSPADGSVRRLTSMRARNDCPNWSPDGRQIVFQSQRGSTRQLWIMPAEGGAPRQITSGPWEASHPQFSPRNPDEILFLQDHRTLCILTLSTGSVRELPGYHEGSFLLDYPSFSPDGERVYFSVSRKTGDIYVLEGD